MPIVAQRRQGAEVAVLEGHLRPGVLDGVVDPGLELADRRADGVVAGELEGVVPLDDRRRRGAATAARRMPLPLATDSSRSDHSGAITPFGAAVVGDRLRHPRLAAVAAGDGHEPVLGDDEVRELLAVLLERPDVG